MQDQGELSAQSVHVASQAGGVPGEREAEDASVPSLRRTPLAETLEAQMVNSSREQPPGAWEGRRDGNGGENRDTPGGAVLDRHNSSKKPVFQTESSASL